MRIYLMTMLFIALLTTNHRKIVVIERQKSVSITSEYVANDEDSIFCFNKKKYLITSREFFENEGNIKKALLRRAIGYLELSRQDLLGEKNSDFSQTIVAEMIDDKHIKVNSVIYIISKIDRKHKRLYYILQGKPQYLNCLIYK